MEIATGKRVENLHTPNPTVSSAPGWGTGCGCNEIAHETQVYNASDFPSFRKTEKATSSKHESAPSEFSRMLGRSTHSKKAPRSVEVQNSKKQTSVGGVRR